MVERLNERISSVEIFSTIKKSNWKVENTEIKMKEKIIGKKCSSTEQEH